MQAGGGVSAADAKETYNYTLTMNKVQRLPVATNALMALPEHGQEMESPGAMMRGRTVGDQ